MSIGSQNARNRTEVRGPACGPEAVEPEIAQLAALDAPALRQRWAQLLGDDLPPSLGRKLMMQAISHRLQERKFGGLKPSTVRILDRVAGGTGSAESTRSSARKAGAGPVLIREWTGMTHRVTVLDKDVVYRGRRYKSLSEVARVITGTHWSGPMFFGLRDRPKEMAHG